MKLAVSNIAWPGEQDEAVASAFLDAGVSGIEIAPTKLWPAPLEATDAQVDACRRLWESRGLPIVAAQALLFGQPGLTLFESAEVRGDTLEYLQKIVRLCGRLGARSLVFGSPKNRRVEGRNLDQVHQEAVDFFGKLGETAQEAGTALVLEANPTEYGADYLTRGSEALALVKAVGHPGVQLHLDSACMTLAGDDTRSLISEGSEVLAHYHASEPYLGPVGLGTVDHRAFASELVASGYQNWVSIEMRQEDPFDVRSLVEAVQRVRECYPA